MSSFTLLMEDFVREMESDGHEFENESVFDDFVITPNTRMNEHQIINSMARLIIFILLIMIIIGYSGSVYFFILGAVILFMLYAFSGNTTDD